MLSEEVNLIHDAPSHPPNQVLTRQMALANRGRGVSSSAALPDRQLTNADEMTGPPHTPLLSPIVWPAALPDLQLISASGTRRSHVSVDRGQRQPYNTTVGNLDFCPFNNKIQPPPVAM